MNDFVKHRLALERAWEKTQPMDFEDTNPDNFEDTQPMDFNAPIDMQYEDDVYSDVVRLVTFVLLFSICAAAFL